LELRRVIQVQVTKKGFSAAEKRQRKNNNRQSYGGWLAACVSLGAITLALTTALTVGAARGVAIAACAAYTDQLYEYTPMQVKQAIVGYGKAEKQQIQQMVKLLLKMDHIAKPDDAADAIAIALTHAATGPAREQFLMK
jgi:hypothetical protein